jgi:hypothetical protein
MRAAAILAVLLPGPVQAADAGVVAEYQSYAGQLDALIGGSGSASPARAECIVTAFEAERGPGGIDDLLRLMRTVAGGAEFDDPVIVEFNERHGAAYKQVLRGCRDAG